MTDLNPVRTRLKATSTADALAGAARAKALHQKHEGILAGNEAAKIQARDKSYAASHAQAMERQDQHKAYVEEQKKRGFS